MTYSIQWIPIVVKEMIFLFLHPVSIVISVQSDENQVLKYGIILPF
jgi:hypothetical protein